jgi:hypothetical protein
MKSSGFILYFALVVALTLFACMQPPPSGAGKATAVCDSNAIAAKVVDLNPPFDAEAFGDRNAKGSGCDVPPTGSSPSAFAAKITAAFNIATVYSDGNWASLFAFVAPDEDFVETYKLWVLANAASGSNLQSLQIQIPLPTPRTVDVFNNFNNPNSNLGKKKIWTDALT